MAGQLLKIMGQNFRAFLGENYAAAVPEATNCQVTISGNMESAATKDSVGGYEEEQMTSKQWSVQVDDVDASYTSLRALISQFNSDTKVDVGWDQTTGAQNRSAVGAAYARSGKAILNDISIVANNRTTTNVTTQYQGSGALS